MGNYTHTNFFSSTLAGGAGGVGTNLQLSDTSLYLATGDGSKAGSPSVGAPGMVLLGTVSATHELIKYTGVSGDQLTGLSRAQESTSAVVWGVGTSVEGVETAGMMGHILYDDGGAMSTNGSGGLTIAQLVSSDAGAVSTNGGGILSATALAYGAGVSSSHSLLDYSVGNHENEYWTPQSGGTAQGHVFLSWNGAAQVTPFAVGSTGVVGNTTIDNTGKLAVIAGQTVAGAFGVPVVVGQALNTHVSATTTQTLISFTPPTSGLYRVCGWFILTGTVPASITMAVTYHEPNTNNAFFANPFCDNGTPQAVSGLSISDNQPHPLLPCVVYADGTAAVTVTYHNATATPSDYVSVYLERLS